MKHSSAESHPFSKIFVTCNFLIHLLSLKDSSICRVERYLVTSFIHTVWIKHLTKYNLSILEKYFVFIIKSVSRIA